MGRQMPIQHMLPELPGPVFDDPGEPSGSSPAQWARLVLGAAMRRKLLALALFVMGIAALAAYYRSRTPLYLVEAKILVQRTAYSSPEDPARSANVLVHRRENLVDLVKQTNLLAGAKPVRAAPAAPRWPSWLPSLGKRVAPADDDPLDWLVWTLDRALKVTTGYDGTINISLTWPNPEEAFRLVEAAQQNFLEARHLQEITATDEVISILQGRTAMLREQVDRAIEEAQREVTRTPGTRSEDSGNPSAPRSDPAVARAKVEELVALKSKLDAKEHAIGDVEEFRRRRLADLMAQLDEKRTMYSDTYPGVVALRQDVESLSRESPQVIALREEARRLREQYTERVAREGASGSVNETATALALAAARASRPDRAMSSVLVEQDERVRDARARYASMLDRLNMAQLERDSARAAFKHRYNVAWPAEVPREPFSPKPLKVLGLGSVAVVLMALLCAAGPDLWSGKVIQRWQLERSLELPVLAELDRE